MIAELDQRVSRLEEDRVFVHADIATIRAQYKTDMAWIRESLERIEGKIDERPSRAEIQHVNGAARSTAPRLDAKGPFGWSLSLRRVPPWVVTAVLLTAEALAFLYLRK